MVCFARGRGSRNRLLAPLPPVLCAALLASSLPAGLAQTEAQVQQPTQTPGSTAAGATPQRAKPGANPIADAMTRRDAQAVPQTNVPKALPNYVSESDAAGMREPREPGDTLPLFGYTLFEPARLAIQARRAALSGWPIPPAYGSRDLDANGRPLRQTSRRPLTQEEIDAVAKLTNQQKLDLFERQRDGRLTEEERVKYRALLDPPTTVRPELVYDPSDDLTEADQLRLLERQRDGLLTLGEQRRYHTFLSQAQPQVAAPPKPSPADLLTPAQRIDLLRRAQAGTLTPAERATYGEYLAPHQPAAGQVPAALSPVGAGGYSPVRGAGEVYRPQSGAYTGGEQFGSLGVYGQGAAGIGAGLLSGAGQYPFAPQAAGIDGGGLRPSASGSNGVGGGNLMNEIGPGSLPTGAQRPLYVPNSNGSPFDGIPGSSAADSALYSGSVPSVSFWPPDVYHTTADPWSLIFSNRAASTPANYQISGGDRITVRYWSPTMETKQLQLQVDPRGYVLIPEVGEVNLAGQTAAGAERILLSRLRGYYRNVVVSVELQQLRTIPVTLTGEAFAAGTYQVPAVATTIDLLIASGGPTDDGTLRKIQVWRRGALAGTIDMYRLLITGDRTTDVRLEPGDVVVIPGHEARVSVRGEVRHPAIYELLPGEGIRDALRYAEGVKPSGVSQRVQVTTVQPGKDRIIKDIDVNSAGSSSIALYDGDSVDVLSVRAVIANKVSIEGAVDQPSEYALTPGMTVRDLVLLARGPLPEAYPDVAHLVRLNPDNTTSLIPVDLEKALTGDPAANVSLQRWDRLKVFSRQDFVAMSRRKVTVSGAVKREGIYSYSDNMRVSDLLLDANGVTPEAYTDEAYLMHSRPDGSNAYEFLDLKAAMRREPKADLPLQENDTLFVFRADQARFTPEHRISVQGEVLAQGDYPRGEGMRLSEALKLAGGLTPRAGTRVQVAHSRISETDPGLMANYSPSDGAVSPDPVLRDGDLITVQGRGDFRDKPYVVRVDGEVNAPGPIVLSGPDVKLSEVIRLAGGLRADAYPQEVTFHRNPQLLASDVQKQNADLLAKVNDVLNQQEYKRALALSDIERYQAIGRAAASNAPIAIPGVTAAPDVSATATATAAATQSIFTHDLVSTPRTLTPADLQPAGNVSVNLANALRRPSSPDDIVMKDGDSVFVPQRPTTVQVIGAVMHATGVLYQKDLSVQDYITAAGGYAPDAAKGDRVLVIHLGGGLTPANKVQRIEPGDVILVPTKVMSEKLSSRSSQIDSIFRSLTTSALIILVAKKLLGL